MVGRKTTCPAIQTHHQAPQPEPLPTTIGSARMAMTASARYQVLLCSSYGLPRENSSLRSIHIKEHDNLAYYCGNDIVLGTGQRPLRPLWSLAI